MSFSSNLTEIFRRRIVDLLLNLCGYFSWFDMGIVRHDEEAAVSGGGVAAAASGASAAATPHLLELRGSNATAVELDEIHPSAASSSLDSSRSHSLSAGAGNERIFQPRPPPPIWSVPENSIDPWKNYPTNAVPAAVAPSYFVAQPPIRQLQLQSLLQPVAQTDSDDDCDPKSELITTIGAPDDANRSATEDGIDDMEEGERMDRLRYLELLRAVTRSSLPAQSDKLVLNSSETNLPLGIR